MESNQLNNTEFTNEEATFELLTLTCEVDKDGDKFYYNKEGYFHRIHGPAVIYKDGYKAWYKNGSLHREDGPASIWSNGDEWFYIDNVQLTKEQFIQWQKYNGIEPIK